MLNLDIHILISALSGELSSKERGLLSSHPWSISAIVLWEIAKLADLKRIELSLEDPEVTRVLSKIHVWPIDLSICKTLKQLDFKSDPADELIAATSIVHQVPLLTRDKKIKKSKRVPLAL
jgi:PIN domain nuclease of toxin-antitoxin system